jgi:hypothetical protein
MAGKRQKYGKNPELRLSRYVKVSLTKTFSRKLGGFK